MQYASFSKTPTYTLKTLESAAARMNVTKIQHPTLQEFTFFVESKKIVAKKEASINPFREVEIPEVDPFKKETTENKDELVKEISSFAKTCIRWAIKNRRLSGC